MKLLGSLLLAAVAKGQACVPDGLISAECDSSGFSVTVNEACRAADFAWIDWSSTFIDADKTVVALPTGIGAACLPSAATLPDNSVVWQYTPTFTDCNQGVAVVTAADDNGVQWYEYALYLNYVAAINPSHGTGSLQQLEQTTLKCRVPANMQENAMIGDITIVNGGADSVIEDQLIDIELWSNIQLDVYQGGFTATPAYGNPITNGGTIGIGENVKLQINDVAGGVGTPMTQDYNIAIKDCWASTVSSATLVTPLVTGQQKLTFYGAQCPNFNWVTGVTESTNIAANLAVELKQFAFNGDPNFFYSCEIDVCLKTSPAVDDDAGDCVPISTLDACVAPAVYGPPGAGRRRREIISTRITRDTHSHGPNSGEYSIDWSHCAETALDKSGIVTCIKFKSKGSNANVVSLSFFTGALVWALY